MSLPEYRSWVYHWHPPNGGRFGGDIATGKALDNSLLAGSELVLRFGLGPSLLATVNEPASASFGVNGAAS